MRYWVSQMSFQHTAARRRLGGRSIRWRLYRRFQHTAARRRLEKKFSSLEMIKMVSTHSRPKAAGYGLPRTRITVFKFQHTAARRRLEITSAGKIRRYSFNTQPPEGGWANTPKFAIFSKMFQHTAARRRLVGH